MQMIMSIMSSPSIRRKPPRFKFDTSQSSLEFNKKVLETFDYDLEKLIPSFKNNVISPGSKLRDPILLDPLLNNHKHWKLFHEIMTEGVSCDFKENF